MIDYYRLVSEELLIKLRQIKQFIKKHGPTIGLLTEEILRSFLKEHLPKSISVEQGFILTQNGELSKQCDILIYDSDLYAPFYRINNLVVIPAVSVIAIIEVKTTINKKIFHDTIDYFSHIGMITSANKYLFIYNSCEISNLYSYFVSYKHKGTYQQFDHDTFELLPDEITGINKSYHLKRDYVIGERDMKGYSSYFYENHEKTEINALLNFYLSICNLVESYNISKCEGKIKEAKMSLYFGEKNLKNYFAFGLFDM